MQGEDNTDSIQKLKPNDEEPQALRHDTAVRQEELDDLQIHVGSQQARIDYLEGSNSQLCIELQSATAHYQKLVADLQQVQ